MGVKRLFVILSSISKLSLLSPVIFSLTYLFSYSCKVSLCMLQRFLEFHIVLCSLHKRFDASYGHASWMIPKICFCCHRCYISECTCCTSTHPWAHKRHHWRLHHPQACEVPHILPDPYYVCAYSAYTCDQQRQYRYSRTFLCNPQLTLCDLVSHA